MGIKSFALVEILAAIAVISIAILPLFDSFFTSRHVGYKVRDYSMAYVLAYDKMELIRWLDPGLLKNESNDLGLQIEKDIDEWEKIYKVRYSKFYKGLKVWRRSLEVRWNDEKGLYEISVCIYKLVRGKEKRIICVKTYRRRGVVYAEDIEGKHNRSKR